MGCMNCKIADAVISKASRVSQTDSSTLATQTSNFTEGRAEVEGSTSRATSFLSSTRGAAASSGMGTEMIELQDTSVPKRSRSRFSVRPGYSSGASSFDGSVTVEDGERAAEKIHLLERKLSSSDILGLSSLRQEMVADGDLTKTVVRIEPSCGQPIEEVYDGIADGLVLGSGVSGLVRLVTHKATQVKYAVKILDLSQIGSNEGLKQLRNEIYIMCQLDHPNIVRIEEVYESTDKIYIVQELCLGGDLFDRLDEQPDFHYTEHQCARLVKQMLSAVRYLHSKGIIHRDLKLENFLFSTPDPLSELRMIDFGLSKHFIFGQHHQESVGTPYTVAPEVIRGHYDEKSDIWALGVITFLLLSGETPFGGLDGEHPLLVKQNIERAQIQFEPLDLWESVSQDAIAFVKRLLNPDPAMRPTAKEAQKDDWIQIWGKKDSPDGNTINPKVLGALMAFKEQSDMQKLLSKVLSFTLLPEQLVELRTEFEKIDSEGTGEVPLNDMEVLLSQYAETSLLASLTEPEIKSLLESISVGKGSRTIGWHEFLSAVLSQAKVDDRNLRLAFDRMDMQRKGYITLQDLRDMLGNSVDAENLERVWLDSLTEVESNLDCIYFADFKRLMKGQPPSSSNHEEEISLSVHLSDNSDPIIEISPKNNAQYMYANILLGIGIFAVGMAMKGITLWQCGE
ncbi:hypothetical protein ACA910_020645 [Epithemia clementina (nom. ined.)]